MNITLIAFFMECVQGVFQQLGFIIMKLSHRKVESQQSRNEVVITKTSEDDAKNDDNFNQADA